MNKPRTYLCVLMTVLLLAIQQFGFAHALTHLTSTNPQRPARGDTQHPAEKVCIECVAFAQIGTGLTGQAPVVVPPAPQIEVAAVPVRVHTPEFIPAFRSRAPPLPA